MVACQSCCWCGVHLARRGDVDGPRELLAARLDSNNIGRWGKSDARIASSKLMVARSGRCTDFGNMPPHHCPASSVGPAVLNGGAGWAMSDWAASAQIPLAADVREPCFWSYQLARTSETRQWLAERETLSPPQKLTIGEVHWVLDQQRGGSTLLIHRVRDAASGATRFLIRSGRVPLARIGWKCARMDLPMTHSPKKRQRRT